MTTGTTQSRFLTTVAAGAGLNALPGPLRTAFGAEEADVVLRTATISSTKTAA
jgi:hypothetical protein